MFVTCSTVLLFITILAIIDSFPLRANILLLSVEIRSD
jgi:hypothetical protein